MLKQVKPGWKTTEFWITGLTLLGSTALALEDKVSGKYAVAVSLISTIAYSLARNIKKR